MGLGRIYTVSFSNVTIAAAQDLVQIIGPSAGKLILINRIWLGHTSTTLGTAQGAQLRCRHLPATVTVGSGGTTGITPSKRDQGDAACSSTTCATNNTTAATTTGTAVVLFTVGIHIYNHFEKRFDPPALANPSTAFVFELLSTITGTAAFSGGAEITEIG